MCTISEMYERWAALNIYKAVPNIIKNSEHELILLNQNQLFNQSIDSIGQPLGLYKSLAYALNKNRRNPRPGFGRPDLFDTGDFFNGFYVTINSDSYSISSADSKTPDIIAKYGPDIFGLTPESKQEYAAKVVYQGIRKYIQEQTRVGGR